GGGGGGGRGGGAEGVCGIAASRGAVVIVDAAGGALLGGGVKAAPAAGGAAVRVCGKTPEPARAVPVLAPLEVPLFNSASNSSSGASRAALISRSKPISRCTRGSGFLRKSSSVCSKI